MPSDPPSLSPPAEAVGDPGNNSSGFRCLKSHLHLLTGHRMGLWYGPVLGGFSPPNPAAQQCPVHLAAHTTRISLLWQCRRGQAAFTGVPYLFCPSVFNFFPGKFSGPHYFEAFICVLELLLSPIAPESWKHVSQMTPPLTGESLMSPNSQRMPDFSFV